MAALIALALIAVGYFAFQYWKYKASDDGAPYVPLEPEVVEAVLRLAKVGSDDIVYDLGSGDGRIPIMAALKYQAKAVGIEVDRFRYFYSQTQKIILRLGNQVQFINDNIFLVDISKATVVTMFLLQETNEVLVEKFLQELKPGTRIVSAAFYIPDWEPLAIDEVHTTPFGPLYLYEIGVSDPNKTTP